MKDLVATFTQSLRGVASVNSDQLREMIEKEVRESLMSQLESAISNTLSEEAEIQVRENIVDDTHTVTASVILISPSELMRLIKKHKKE